MAKNNLHITSENAAEWLASCGYLFPRNSVELTRFHELYGDTDPAITGREIDPYRIIKRVANSISKQLSIEDQTDFDTKTVKVPRHILELMKKAEEDRFEKKNYVRNWRHKSVLRLIEESENENPYEEIRARARKKILQAIDRGWEGPPFSAIQLAKLLDIEVIPNDSILDACTISLGRNKFRIEYNPVQKPTRLNFSISHEIAHTFFSDCHEAIRNREETPDENKELEELCNIGASELQLPYIIFPDDANKLKEITLLNLIDLAKKYKTSLEALFLAFVEIVDKPCAVMICAFESNSELVINYYKSSSSFKPSIPAKFKIPRDSIAYQCTTPGWSKQETVKWDFLEDKYDIFCIGLSPVRKDKKARVGILIVPNDGREDLQNRRIKINTGDATKPDSKGVKIIAQVVNTYASLARGFGKSLKLNYPIIQKELDQWKLKGVDFRLGKSQLVQVNKDTYVFQMLAQKGLMPKDGKIPLDYEALELCLIELKEAALELQAEVHMPLIGAGNARGKWEIIEGMIYAHLVNHNVPVNIYIWGKAPADFRPREGLTLFNEKSTWRKEK